MNKKRIGIGVLVVCVGMYIALQIIPYHKNKQPSAFHKQNGTPLVIAHGGAKTLYPENTAYAFDQVYAMGVDAMEVDLRLSKDGVLLTHHDATIEDTSEHTGKVKSYTFAQLQSFHFGYQFKNKKKEYVYRNVAEDIKKQLVPLRLEDLFERYPDMLFILELKDHGKTGKQAAKIAYDTIVKYQKEKQVCVASFDEETLDTFKGMNKEGIVTSLDYEKAKDFVVANLLGYGYFTDYVGEGMQLPTKERNIDLNNKYFIYKVHHNDMFIHYWTIDDKKTIKELIEKGADGIISDRPDIVKEVLQEMGYT